MSNNDSNKIVIKEPDYRFELLYVLERAKNLSRKFIIGSVSIIYHIAVIVWMSVDLSQWHDKHRGTIIWDSLVLIFVSTLFFATIVYVIVQKQKFDRYCLEYELNKDEVITDAFNFNKKLHNPKAEDVKKAKAIYDNELKIKQIDLKAFKDPDSNIFKKTFLKKDKPNK